MNKSEASKSIGLVEKYNFKGIRLKKEPPTDFAIYLIGLLGRISVALPNADLEKIYKEAAQEIEISAATGPMAPIARELMSEAIEFLKENLVIKQS